MAAARCGDHLGEDLWHYRAPNGRGLELVFNYLVPYCRQEKNWKDQAEPLDRQTVRAMRAFFQQGAAIYRSPVLQETADFLEKL